jgi:hypothetical protein
MAGKNVRTGSSPLKWKEEIIEALTKDLVPFKEEVRLSINEDRRMYDNALDKLRDKIWNVEEWVEEKKRNKLKPEDYMVIACYMVIIILAIIQFIRSQKSFTR